MKFKVTDEMIEDLLRASFRNLQRMNTVPDAFQQAEQILENKAQENSELLEEGIVQNSVVEDPAVIARLDASPKQKGYRSVVLNADGTFGSPMANSLKGTKKGSEKVKTAGFELGKWEQAEENPSLADENGKVTLVKPGGNTVASVDYNPYIHNRLDKVNAQFKDAWKRQDLVYVETEVPLDDLESGYHAEKAALPVGIHSWSNGALMLSRYDKPVRIVPWEEVADDWVARFKDKGVHFDIVSPALLPILAERGVEILPPHKGMGKDCFAAYEEWKGSESSEENNMVKQGQKPPRRSLTNYDLSQEERRDIQSHIEKLLSDTRNNSGHSETPFDKKSDPRIYILEKNGYLYLFNTNLNHYWDNRTEGRHGFEILQKIKLDSFTDAESSDSWLTSGGLSEGGTNRVDSRATTGEQATSSTRDISESNGNEWQNVEEPTDDAGNLLRQGDGSYTDEELSFLNDPAAKVAGESFRTKKQQHQYAERVRKQMRGTAQSLAEKLHLPIEIVESTEGLTGKKA